MPESPDAPQARYRELALERLVLVEPGTSRPRAVLEILPALEESECDHTVYSRPRVSLLTAAGDPVITVELNGQGDPLVQIGGQGRGTSVIVTRRSVAIWENGNEVAVLDARRGGRLQVMDGDGKLLQQLP